MNKETAVSALVPGDIVSLKHGPQAVSHIITYAQDDPTNGRPGWNMVDVFFVGQSYPLYYRDNIEVSVVGHIDLEAVRYAAEELRK